MTGQEIKNALKGKGYTMQAAADKLEIDRTTLHRKLNEATLEDDFIKALKQTFGIDAAQQSRTPVNSPLVEKVVDGVTKNNVFDYQRVTLLP